IDGPGYGNYMRDQLQARMRQQGKLPPNVQLDLPELYKGMTGAGELWVRPDGLPLRQIVTTHFPPSKDSQTDATVTVDFSDYLLVPGTPAAPGSPLVAFSSLNLESALGSLAAVSPNLLANGLVLVLGCCVLVVIVRFR